MKTLILFLLLGWSLGALAEPRPKAPGTTGVRSLGRAVVPAGSETGSRRLPPISEEARRHLLKGRAWFRVQAYDKAIAAWTRAFLLHAETLPDPLFNIATARYQKSMLTWDRKRKLVEEQQAYFAFQSFLAMTQDPVYQQDPGLMKLRAVAEQASTELDGEIDRLEAALRAEDKVDRERSVRLCEVALVAPGNLPASCTTPARPATAR